MLMPLSLPVILQVTPDVYRELDHSRVLMPLSLPMILQVTPEVYRELDHSRGGRGGAPQSAGGTGSSSVAAASGAGPMAGVRASGAAAMQVGCKMSVCGIGMQNVCV